MSKRKQWWLFQLLLRKHFLYVGDRLAAVSTIGRMCCGLFKGWKNLVVLMAFNVPGRF
jgi:hypothetical protein